MEHGMNGMAGSPPESVVEASTARTGGGAFAMISPDDPRPGETWRHYKGHDYEIVAVGMFESDRTPMVAYRCPKSGQGWVRTLANFTEPVTVDGIAGRPVPYRRFSRVGRPKDDVSPNGKTDDLYRLAAKVGAAGGRPEDRMLDDLAGLLSTVGFRVDADHSICDCVEELIGRVWANEAGSQHGKPPVPGSLARMREAWMALQLVIVRLETATHYFATPESVLLEILEGTDDVKRHLDAAMGEAEDAAGIAPGEAPH